MPINKIAQADNGIVVGYHRATSLNVDLIANIAQVTVNSHANESASLANLPIAWQWRLEIPVARLAGDGTSLLDEIEDALISLDGSPFAGGMRVADHTDTIQAARERAWASIKAARDQAENGNFVFEGGVYQADKAHITGAVQLAALAKAGGQPFSQTWTLEDNTNRTLDADQMIGLGIAIGQYVSGVYAIGRDLRDRINNAKTIEEVAEVRWPSQAAIQEAVQTAIQAM